MNNININASEIKSLFMEIGLNTPGGDPYKKRLKKHRQIFDYIMHIEKAVSRLSSKRTIRIVDCACGKSYLSFVANHYLTKIMNKNVEFICIDFNNHVIDESKRVAKTLDFTNMTFICDDIFNVELNNKTDIVYSLHACDTATDMTIAKGILENAEYIMTVSCCPHYIRSNIRKHPLTSISKHSIYKERIADMVGDSMRALMLETRGYKTTLFDYVPSSETPKNVMLRANKVSLNSKRVSEATAEYNALSNLFNTEPMLRQYLEKKKEQNH